MNENRPNVFILAVGGSFLLLNLWAFSEAFLLNHSGAAIQGMVSRVFIIRRRGNISYSADYTFTVSGNRYEGTGNISRDTYLRLRPNDSIALRYVPSNPSLSETEEMSHHTTTLFLTGFLGFPVSVFILILSYRRNQQMAQEPDDLLPDQAPSQAIELPPTVRGIAFTLYPVLDMKRARKFYEEDLGLKVAQNIRDEWIEYHLWDNCFAITTMMKESFRPSAEAGGRIALEVNDVDAWVEDFRKKGIGIKSEPFSTPTCRMAVILDPEGNSLVLHCKTSHGSSTRTMPAVGTVPTGAIV